MSQPTIIIANEMYKTIQRGLLKVCLVSNFIKSFNDGLVFFHNPTSFRTSGSFASLSFVTSTVPVSTIFGTSCFFTTL